MVVVTAAQTGYQTVTLTPSQTCVDTSTLGNETCPGGPDCVCGVAYDERFQFLNTVLGTNNSVQLIL